MNEISPDNIKGKRWVGSLYVEEKEPERRRRIWMRGTLQGWAGAHKGDNPMQRVHFCDNGTPASKSGWTNVETCQLWDEGASASESGEMNGVGSNVVIRVCQRPKTRKCLEMGLTV
ncbi:hypothetical protein Y032_0019g3876 [Ancylostoma ceylanicum]|uniref:Uncharacterized protein n=1 Tax=Ancylostoma ceylanicum TaxID=53326 RepID=A0A016V482_9BILA|nr:hypothetical protein Y032_0019g3876 [Ancylostoma ceylanicum]